MPKLSRTRRLAAVALSSALVISAGACSDDDAASTPSTTTSQPTTDARQPALEGVVSVVAAESLTESLPLIVERFNVLNPGVEITLRFDSTPVLTMELLDGAPGDVFISADEANMRAVTEAGRTDGPSQTLAQTRLVIVTPAGNPELIAGLGDLDGADRVVLCDEGAPCGALADAALADAGVDLGDVARSSSGAEAVLAVAGGEADAALVFETDVQSDATVETVALGGAAVTSTHTIATLAPGGNALAARAFVDFVRSPESMDILSSHGFRQPT